ncbi:hypothetical protein D3C86_1140200 [compost metagenome]
MLECILNRYLRKNLRRERWKLIEHDFAALTERVSNPEDARIEQTDNITRIGFGYDVPVLSQELLRLGELDLLARPYVLD